MQNFIVLGLIPGTNLEITFALWLLGGAAIAAMVFAWHLQRTHRVRNWLIATTIAWTIRHRQLA